MNDYKCEKCGFEFGYLEGNSKCLRCDEEFSGFTANCTTCGSGNYETLCPRCEHVVDVTDEL